jgi:dTDP-3-amino-2,3,6-trideoxy-4-keto-D-glucose/dTDP-3-amino-3,4,6-trideoxy-alpha-D-glucose/dTDP-2,6-dideoxy-D-kanosamine transaminase
MGVPLNDLSRRSRRLASELHSAAARVIDSGWYLMGPEVDAFERDFANANGAAGCIGVASGTDALALALLGTGCLPGDEVIAAANAGGYATIAALQVGLRPRYADVDAATLCLSAETIAPVLTASTRAVVVTHLYGRLADVESLVALCRERGIKLVEDCAQAAGAERRGCRAGGFGDAAAFSFYPTKNLGALGDAGAVVTSDPEVEARVRRLAQYGWEPRYVVAEAGGRNSRLDELQAAVLRAGLVDLDAANTRRREICAAYAAAGAPLVAAPGPEHVCHLAVIRVPDRDAVARALADAGVATTIHYPVPDHRQPAWRDVDPGARLPVTERAVEEILTLPCFPELTDDEVLRVCEALRAL